MPPCTYLASFTYVKIGGKPVSRAVMRSVLGFVLLYMGLFAVSTVLLSGASIS